MTIPLSTLVAQLKEDAPAVDGVPTDPQYDRYVKDAVTDFNRRVGRVKLATLTLVVGTASYALPSDFLSMVWLQKLEDVYLTSGYYPEGETWVIANGQITFSHSPYDSSTPVTYAGDRDYKYKCGFVLSNDSYADMTDEEAGIILLHAVAKVKKVQADKAANLAWQYQIGDERVSKERLAEALQKAADANMKEYRSAVRSYTTHLIHKYAVGNYS